MLRKVIGKISYLGYATYGTVNLIKENLGNSVMNTGEGAPTSQHLLKSSREHSASSKSPVKIKSSDVNSSPTASETEDSQHVKSLLKLFLTG